MTLQRGLDVRLPIGLMFTIVGILLVAYGSLGGAASSHRAPDVNINLWWGFVLLAFGLVMLWLGRRGGAKHKPSAT